MNFPMMENINENTNAKAQETQAYMETVKEAILAALPEGGIEQRALDAAVEEIIAAMPSQTATAQTKKFTNVVQGAASSAKTFTGCGLAYVRRATGYDIVQVDGFEVDGSMSADEVWMFYFEKKFYISPDRSGLSGYSMDYIVMT